jgi:hypothetical protein
MSTSVSWGPWIQSVETVCGKTHAALGGDRNVLETAKRTYTAYMRVRTAQQENPKRRMAGTRIGG